MKTHPTVKNIDQLIEIISTRKKIGKYLLHEKFNPYETYPDTTLLAAINLYIVGKAKRYHLR